MRKKIYLYLTGGLGNQLFQYSCAKNLAINLNADLIIEDRLGFINDGIFKRKIELPKNLYYKKISTKERIIFLFLLFIKKIFYRKKIYINYKNSIIIDETNEKKFIKNFFHITNSCKKIYLVGFFQSEKYFIDNKDIIINKIKKNTIKNKSLLRLSKTINKKSLMIGMRFFEEAPIKIRKNFGGIEFIKFFNHAIKKMSTKYKFKKAYVFTTSLNNKLIKNKLNLKSIIINQSNGYSGTSLDNILIISKFKNFIISNSSFYWWGAYLSSYKTKIKIVASNKFKNQDTLPAGW